MNISCHKIQSLIQFTLKKNLYKEFSYLHRIIQVHSPYAYIPTFNTQNK